MSTDRIIIKGLVFYGYHGVNSSEREQGQRFVVDIELQRDLSVAGKSDNLRDTVSYSDVYKTVKAVIEGTPRNLLEAVAESVASAVLNDYPVESVRVLLKKPEVPIKGSILDYAAVEIVRTRAI